MAEIEFVELKCQRCGGELEEKGGAYACKSCGKKWQVETLHDFSDMLEACEQAIQEQRIADIANLRQLLWREVNQEYVSNLKVSEYCTDILKKLPHDFYANFYLATCGKNKAALGEFLTDVNIENHTDDIALVLDYLLKSLKPEWIMGVSNFIEKIKDVDMSLYHKYRTKFENEYQNIEDGVFEADLERDVFIAYSSADMPEVMELVAALEEEGLLCFVAARNMRHGSGSVENYRELLHTAINNCRVFVFVSSGNSRSFNCDAYKEEIKYIGEHRKNMPRVEYLIQNYSGKAVERNFKNFFSGLEYCVSVQDVVERVADIIMNQDSEPEPVQRKSEEEICDTVSKLGDYNDIGGGYITFGAYPQSKKADNVKIGKIFDEERGYYLGSDNCLYDKRNGEYYKVEPIKWKVLSRDGDLFIASDLVIDVKRFNELSNNYADSEIRNWLRNDFYNKAFSTGQKNKIITAYVDNSPTSTGNNPNSYACNNTMDKVFLLSRKEAEQHFNGNAARMKKVTDYAKVFFRDGSGMVYSRWWLRSPCNDKIDVQYVGNDGDFCQFPSLADDGIVPALKISQPQNSQNPSSEQEEIERKNRELQQQIEEERRKAKELEAKIAQAERARAEAEANAKAEQERRQREQAEAERKRREEEERKRREQAEAEARARAEEANNNIIKLGDYNDNGGSIITFGTYPQSKKAVDVQIGRMYDKARGYYLGSDNCLYAECKGEYFKVEAIKWQVLSRSGELFLVSNIILDTHRFDSKSNNYAKSEIRSWLNGEFYNKAFSDEQKGKIITTTIDNSLSSTGFSSNPYICENTHDKIFLLSRFETAQYLKGEPSRQYKVSAYTKARNLLIYGNGASDWWLRSSYRSIVSGYYVQKVTGMGDFLSSKVGVTYCGVVPALKIKV